MFDCSQDVSDRVDKEDSDSFLVHALETNKSDVLDDVAANGQQQVKQGWHERLDSVRDSKERFLRHLCRMPHQFF